MSDLEGQARARYVRRMFARIAGRYDLLNRLMTLGQDGKWRRATVRRLAPEEGQLLLDIGAGTGDLAFEIQRQAPSTLAVAADFTPEMIHHGRQRPAGGQPAWVIADCQRLPFADGSFDGVVSGFLLRNLGDLPASLREQARVLKARGRLVSLETAPPPRGPLRPLIDLHFRMVIPTLGRLLAHDPQAYHYLPSSTEGFHDSQQLAQMIEASGFEGVGFERRMFGTINIHWALRSEEPVRRSGW